ncbi:hypothetical protein ABT063_49850 [Streptomyces sp. NPDC002838]|uniref:hypothetical protein n=1 Tax=Streptomyces sp. NPDC002838 TaxID=3154436 RepID=UPI003326E70B
MRQYALADHQRPGGSNELLRALGLTEFAVARWGMAGDWADWVRRISDLAASGVRRMWLANRGSLPQLEWALRTFGEQVLPRVR